MNSNTVTFRGMEQVVGAYVCNAVWPWGIMCGKDLMFSCSCDEREEAENSLRDHLELMIKGHSKAIYRLQVYKLRDDQEILSNTPYFRAFSFYLFESEASHPYDLNRSNMIRQQQDEIEELKEELADIKADNAEQKKGMGGLAGILNGMLDRPDVQQAIAFKVMGLINGIFPGKKNQKPAQVGGISDQPDPAAGIQITAEQGKKLQQAINVLAAKDPLIGDHLLKVAEIAKNNPAQYSMLISMLK